MGQFLSTLGLGHIFQQGSGIIDKAQDRLRRSGVAGSPWHVDFKTGFKLLEDPDLWKIPSTKEEADVKKRVDALKRSYHAAKYLGFKGSYTSFAKKIGVVHKPAFTFPGFGSGMDVYMQIGKLPKPKVGWTLPGHKYTGPYNALENQVQYDKPTGRTDAIAMQHDVDYSVCRDNWKCKHEAD